MEYGKQCLLMYGMLRADCTDSQTVFSTGSLLTSRCLSKRDGMAGVPEDCASRLLNALHKADHGVSLAWLHQEQASCNDTSWERVQSPGML